MAAPESTTWPLERHTQAKHEILRRYLGAWLPILINKYGHARIIDGFAGPGEYAEGEIGSPLVALQVLLSHPDKKVQEAICKGKIELIFIEQDQRRIQNLEQRLTQQKQQLSCPPQLQTHVICDTFLAAISKILATMEKQRLRNTPIPTFFFIDPFGYSHTPMSIIARILRLPMCEVLINFMYEGVNRFIDVDYPTKEQTYHELFGTSEWQEITRDAPSTSERENRLHDLYRHQLLTVAGAKYVRSFLMRNQRNSTEYFLFFATKNLRGLEEMKRAMWGVDPTGAFQFSDYSNPYQPLLLDTPNYAQLQSLLTTRFKEQEVSIDEIEEYVMADTPFYAFKKGCLSPMESASPPKILVRSIDPTCKRRKGAFDKDKVRISFL